MTIFAIITFSSPATLTANTLYWVGLAAESASGEVIFSGFHNDYNGAYDMVKYQTSGFAAGEGMPTTASANVDGEYAYWFRIYNPNL